MTFIAKENNEKQSFSENEFKDFNAEQKILQPL